MRLGVFIVFYSVFHLLCMFRVNAQPGSIKNNHFTNIDSTLADSVRFQSTMELYKEYVPVDSIKTDSLFKILILQTQNPEFNLSAINLYEFSLLFNKRTNNYLQTIEYLHRAAQIALKNHDTEYANYESWLGYNLSMIGEREEAIHHLYNSLHFVQNNKLNEKFPKLYLLFGFFYKNNNELEKSALHFQNCIDASKQTGDSSSYHTALHELGNIYFMQNKFIEALNYQKQALQIRKVKNNKADIMYSNADIGLTLMYMDSLHQALGYLKNAKDLAQLLNEKWALINIYSSINDIYYQLGVTERKKFYLDSIQILADDLKIKPAYIISYGNWYNYFKLMHKYDLALHNYELMQLYLDSVSNETVQKNISDLEKKYETLKKDQELTLKQEQISRQKFYLFVSLMIVVVVLLFLVLVYRLYQQKKQVVHKLELQNIEIRQQKEELNANNEEIVHLNEHLEATNQELTKIMATKNKFFSIIAHDLKNPFNVLLGYNQMILESTEPISQDEIKRFARMMYDTSKRTYELLQNLLEWSLLQTGNLTPKPEEIYPEALINEVFVICEPGATAKGISIHRQLGANLPFRADFNMVTTVLRNLVTNAVKYSFPETQIIIETQRRENYMQFTVTDSGVGIEVDELDKLFQTGNKFSRRGTAQEMGTGLGLILCKEFIEKNGGTIGASSTPGKGSEFWFRLPLLNGRW